MLSLVRGMREGCIIRSVLEKYSTIGTVSSIKSAGEAEKEISGK
jgi:hypothetical protein